MFLVGYGDQLSVIIHVSTYIYPALRRLALQSFGQRLQRVLLRDISVLAIFAHSNVLLRGLRARNLTCWAAKCFRAGNDRLHII